MNSHARNATASYAPAIRQRRRLAVLLLGLVLVAAAGRAAAQTSVFDDYKCYRVKEAARWRGVLDIWTDDPVLDVDPRCRVVGSSKLYCVPAATDVIEFDGAPLGPPLAAGAELARHRVCYRLKCPRPSGAATRELQDAFGIHQLEKLKPSLLCTGALPVTPASTTTTTVPATTTTTLAPPPEGALVTAADLEYLGAFRLPAADYGNSNLNFSEGPLVFDAASQSIFIVGHTYQQAVAEFTVPELGSGAVVADLPMAAAPVQNFASVLDRAPTTDADNILNRIGGLALLDDGGARRLVVNAYEYYDAPGDNWLTTMTLADADDLAGAAATGFFAWQGGAGHTSGWISPVPPAWQGALGGTHITGQSSGIPIIGRTSVGPSAFAFTPANLFSAAGGATVATVKLLDYSLANPLDADLSNASGTNDLWTHLSRATYGFVVPGTDTYFVVGGSGGHASGVGYKIEQDNGNVCGGYCPWEAADEYAYWWAYDLGDLVAVRAGELQPYEVRPYGRGVFPVPFASTMIGGGSFDPATGRLFLTLQRADDSQGVYANPPIVAVYRFGGT
jgi:hypothetical protein